MALLHTHLHSDVLGMECRMEAILPEPRGADPHTPLSARDAASPPPCLYLLHGLSDDASTWMRRTSIERYVAPLGLAVIMPSVHRSYYTDMTQGLPYWTFISEELPAKVSAMFRVSTAREDTFVAGLSMGGYGAFKLALACPGRFAAGASLSGALDVARRAARADGGQARDIELIFGGPAGAATPSNDLMRLVEPVAKLPAQAQPALFQCCGTEDFLYDDNIRFRDRARSLGLPLTYEEAPGTHEWGFWDRWIQRVLAWLPLRNRGAV